MCVCSLFSAAVYHYESTEYRKLFQNRPVCLSCSGLTLMLLFVGNQWRRTFSFSCPVHFLQHRENRHFISPLHCYSVLQSLAWIWCTVTQRLPDRLATVMIFSFGSYLYLFSHIVIIASEEKHPRSNLLVGKLRNIFDSRAESPDFWCANGCVHIWLQRCTQRARETGGEFNLSLLISVPHCSEHC